LPEPVAFEPNEEPDVPLVPKLLVVLPKLPEVEVPLPKPDLPDCVLPKPTPVALEVSPLKPDLPVKPEP